MVSLSASTASTSHTEGWELVNKTNLNVLHASLGNRVPYHLFKAIPPVNDKKCAQLQCTHLAALSNWLLKAFVVQSRQHSYYTSDDNWSDRMQTRQLEFSPRSRLQCDFPDPFMPQGLAALFKWYPTTRAGLISVLIKESSLKLTKIKNLCSLSALKLSTQIFIMRLYAHCELFHIILLVLFISGLDY